MSEELKTDQTNPEVKEPEVKKEETKQQDAMIPKTRFDEINEKYKEMAEKVSAFEKAQEQAKADAEAKELEAKKEQGKFEELYQTTQKELETYKQYENRSKELEGLITNMVEEKLKSVPEEMHDLVPSNLTAEQTLDWLSKAESKGLFGTKEAKEIGKPSNQSNEKPKVDKANLSPLDKILSGLGK
jgi:dsDNA-specific endonuclease/ATPase MutS2